MDFYPDAHDGLQRIAAHLPIAALTNGNADLAAIGIASLVRFQLGAREYGAAKPDAGLVQSFWAQGMQAGHKNTYDSIAAFSATDFRGDLAKFDVPTLVIHGGEDQIVPVGTSARASAALVKGARLIVYPDGPHGIGDTTHKDRLNQDLLDFLRE